MHADTSGPTTHVPQRVGDRYRLGAVLGRGGMATVYRGHDEQLDRPVAIKLLRGELGDDPTMLRRFETEARRAASVTHPNLVAVYDVGIEDGVPYIVMELVEGGDLATALAVERPMTAERAARIGVEVADALEVAHEAGLVHRDIKPRNILLDRDGHARVTDFGIARGIGDESLTRTGAVLGSVDYFSPEQARGERATASSDLYGLGAVLYELLTGARPFSGDTPYAIATARLRAPAPDPRASNRQIPERLAAIVRRAMARDPDERFASAAELRAALAAWLAEHTESATPAAANSGTEVIRTAPAEEGAASAGPHRRRVALLVAPLGVAVLALVGWLGGGMLMGGAGVPDLPEIVVGEPGGVVLLPTDSPTPSPVVTATATASPSSQAPAPTAAASRSPALTTPTPTPAPAATPVAVARADSPADAVAIFYGLVADGEFDAAYALWSQRMKDAYPRQGNLDGRFEDTSSITFTQLEVVDQTTSAATVQANFVERYDGGGSREFIGYWRLIRSGDAWLLDEPNY
ncbi:MAG TPA: protein kinase [Candidatus Angelobacter sp.]|nr:protein kinase [Candidatus Angelobacter sp.]